MQQSSLVYPSFIKQGMHSTEEKPSQRAHIAALGGLAWPSSALGVSHTVPSLVF
jgi:hypothetical protein